MRAKPAILLLSVLLLSSLSLVKGPARVAAVSVPNVLYVAPGADCLGMTPCYSSPQAAVDAASVGSVIRVAEGNYSPPSGESQVIHITKSLILQGGYRITNWYDIQPFAFPAVLDAQNLGSVITIAGNPEQPIEVVLNGFQMINGQSAQGGGISGTGVQLGLDLCVIKDNLAYNAGGGIFLSNSSSLILTSSRVMDNASGERGGAIALHSSDGISSITNSWIFGNQAASGGGGLSLSGGQMSVKTTMLVDNAVTQPGAAGAGVLSDGEVINLDSTTIARNTGGLGNGLSLSGASTLTAVNLLIAGQSAGISIATPGQGTLDGVLWGSGDTWSNGANTDGDGGLSLQHTYTGDPMFVGLNAADLKTYFHIGVSSPARERSVSTAEGYRDIDEQPVYGSVTDLGADEYFEGHGTTIHVETELGGDIEVGVVDGNPESRNGAFFWDGDQWVTNDTVAHMYFTDAPTRTRLMQYTLAADLNGNSPADQNIGAYHISRSTDSYLAAAEAGGVYRIEAAQYLITNDNSQEIILLKSRGNGYGQAYFDIYIQYTVGTTLAIRDGSAWFIYSETPELASQHTINDPIGRGGSLTTCDMQAIDRSSYWIDSQGGSDMGGLTYNFHASSFPNRYAMLGGCYADEFRLKYLSDTNELVEFRIRPEAYSETLMKQVYLPMIYDQVNP